MTKIQIITCKDFMLYILKRGSKVKRLGDGSLPLDKRANGRDYLPYDNMKHMLSTKST